VGESHTCARAPALSQSSCTQIYLEAGGAALVQFVRCKEEGVRCRGLCLHYLCPAGQPSCKQVSGDELLQKEYMGAYEHLSREGRERGERALTWLSVLGNNGFECINAESLIRRSLDTLVLPQKRRNNKCMCRRIRKNAPKKGNSLLSVLGSHLLQSSFPVGPAFIHAKGSSVHSCKHGCINRQSTIQ